MKGRWIIVALVLVAATAEETKLWRVAQTAFRDGMFDVAESQATTLLQKFPRFESAESAQLLRARAQLEQGKWTEAVGTLSNAVAKLSSPDLMEKFRYWLAEAWLRGDQFPEAENGFVEFLEKHSRSDYRLPSQYGLAVARFQQGHLDAATHTLEQLLKQNPKRELGQEAELLRGQIKLAQQKVEEAEAIFATICQRFAGTRVFYQAHTWLGESRSRRGQWEEALKEYAVVTDTFRAQSSKAVTPSLAAEAWYGAGWTHWRRERFDQAAEAFTAALQYAQSPSLKRNALLKLGEAYLRSGKRTEGVVHLKAFLQAHPSDPMADEVHLAVADLLYAGDDWSGASAEYTQFTAKFPQSRLLSRANLQAGWAAWKLNQTNDALSSFQKAVDVASDPSIASEALFKLADTQFALGQNVEAVASYQRLISSFPEMKSLDRALFQLGLAYRRARNADAAVAAFESLLQRYPASAQAAEAQFQIGLVYGMDGHEPKARMAFATVVEKYPGTPWANRAALAIGESYQREGQPDLAIAELDKLITAAMDSELGQRAFYNRGWCYAATGRAEKTLEEFAAFLIKYPQSPLAPEAQFWMGDYYLRRKDYLKSQEQYQAVAKNYPFSELADVAQYHAGRSAYLRQDYKTAIELYEALFQAFPNSKWRCDARFGQGDALSEIGQFDDALLVFDSIAKQFAGCSLACEALGRKGDCQFTLTRFEEAGNSYRQALECAREADAAIRNQLLYKMGQSAEKAGKLDDAYRQYAVAVLETTVAPDSSLPPERFWLCKAGMAAASVKEQQQQWSDAVKLYSRLLELCPDMKLVLEEKIRKLRVEHMVLF